MKRISKWMCLVLAVVLCAGIAAAPAGAAERQEREPTAETESVLPTEGTVVPVETTAPRETQPEQTFPSGDPGHSTNEPAAPEEPVDEPTAPEADPPAEDTRDLGSKRIQRIVPLYLQTDYPNAPYGGTTVAKSGCSMTSLAMVASFLREEEVSPADLALRFGNYDASNIQRLEAASIVLDLPYEKTTKWKHVVQALKEDKLVIVLMNEKSHFSAAQHFMVLTGITEDGKILVNDPYGPNYTKWELAEGFKCGFPEKKVSKGFTGAWIYDAYVPYDTGTTRYPDITLTQQDRTLLASIIWLEARGESFEGQQAIAEIVLNRMCSDRFPNTLRSVIFAEGQFRSVELLDDAKPGELQYKAIDCALRGTSVLPMEVVHFATYPVNDKQWGKIGGHIFCYDWDYVPAAQVED